MIVEGKTRHIPFLAMFAAVQIGRIWENWPIYSSSKSFPFDHLAPVVQRVGEFFNISRVRMMYYSVSDTDKLGKRKSECSYQESDLRPPDY